MHRLPGLLQFVAATACIVLVALGWLASQPPTQTGDPNRDIANLLLQNRNWYIQSNSGEGMEIKGKYLLAFRTVSLPYLDAPPQEREALSQITVKSCINFRERRTPLPGVSSPWKWISLE